MLSSINSIDPTAEQQPGQLWLVYLDGNSDIQIQYPLCVRASGSFQLFLDLCQHAATLFGYRSGRPGLILATGRASESEVRWTEECTSSCHLHAIMC